MEVIEKLYKGRLKMRRLFSLAAFIFLACAAPSSSTDSDVVDKTAEYGALLADFRPPSWKFKKIEIADVENFKFIFLDIDYEWEITKSQMAEDICALSIGIRDTLKKADVISFRIFERDFPYSMAGNTIETSNIALKDRDSCTRYVLSLFHVLKILNVVDGDTFKADLFCEEELLCQSIPVRVAGIDAPEIKTKDNCEKEAAQKAKEFAQKFLKEGGIILKGCKRDKYFRLLCEVWAGDKNLADELIKANLAVPYDGGTKPKIDWCNKE